MLDLVADVAYSQRDTCSRCWDNIALKKQETTNNMINLTIVTNVGLIKIIRKSYDNVYRFLQSQSNNFVILSNRNYCES